MILECRLALELLVIQYSSSYLCDFFAHSEFYTITYYTIFQKRGMISKIVPIFIGENDDGVIRRYLLRDSRGQKASFPNFKEQIVVESIERATNEVLELMGLGWAFDRQKDVKSIFEEVKIHFFVSSIILRLMWTYILQILIQIAKYQGVFLEGSEENAISNAVNTLKETLKFVERRDRRDCKSFFSSNCNRKDTFSALEEESSQLKAKVDELTKALKRSEKSARRSQRKLKEMQTKYQKEIDLANKHADFQHACDKLFSILIGDKSNV